MPTCGKSARSEETKGHHVTTEQSSSSRRRFLTGAAGAATIGLAGCLDSLTGGENKEGNPDDVEAADSISIAAVEGEGRLFQRLIKNYVEEDTGVNVEVSLFPYDNLFEKTNSVLSTEGDSFDVVFMDDPWFPQLAPHCEPIEKWMPEAIPKDNFIDTTLDIATWPAPKGPVVPSAQGMDEKLRGLVVVGNTQLFAYNQGYYDEVGEKAPETWDDVLRAGKKIDEQIDGANGYAIRGKRGNPINANFFSLGMSRAGDMFDKNWRYQWDSEKGVDTLSFYVNDLKAISPDGVASFDSDQVLNRVGDGRVAQSPAWPAAASLLLDPENADQADNIKFTVIPGAERRAPTQGNWITGINTYSSSDKKKAAGKVLHSFVSKEAQNKYVELGGVPFRSDTFEDNMDAQPWFEALYESLQTAKWRPRTPLWSEIDVTQGKYLNSALTGEMSPKQALTNTKNEVEQMLEKDGYYE